jgi:hypothetical protein
VVLAEAVQEIQNQIKTKIPMTKKIRIKKQKIMIILKIKQKIINLKVYLNYFISLPALTLRNKYKGVYFLPFIYAKFNPNVSPEAEPFISYSFSMFILSLLVLVCFFNIIGYILSIYLIEKYDIENTFPYFKRYIKFYSSTSKFLLVLEILIAFVFLLFIVILNFFLFTRILLI